MDERVGRINLKDTDLCITWDCACGARLNHSDGFFQFEVVCETCQRCYEVGNTVTLTERPAHSASGGQK